MKYRYIALFVCMQMISGCSSLIASEPDKLFHFVSSQQYYKDTKENVKKYVLLPGFDSRSFISVIERKGVTVGKYFSRKKGVAITYKCDYSKGPTSGEVKYRLYPRDPKGTAEFVPSLLVKVTAHCAPLPANKVKEQIALEAKEELLKKQAFLKQEAFEKQQEKNRAAQRKRDATRDAAEAKRKTTPKYLQQKAIARITDAKFRIAAAEKAITHENRIGARTGYVNKSRIYEAGSYLIAYEDELKRAYKDYKQAGGKLPLSKIK